jgi:hypothetical protein
MVRWYAVTVAGAPSMRADAWCQTTYMKPVRAKCQEFEEMQLVPTVTPIVFFMPNLALELAYRQR